MRILASAAALILWVGGSLPVPGQDTGVLHLPGPPPMALPAWLAPLSQARDPSAKATPTEATSSYIALTPPPAVVDHYESQMRAAGIPFETRPDGNGARIEATAERTIGTVRVHQADGGARVEVTYRWKPDPPPAPPKVTAPAPLELEWPDWLEIPDAVLISEQTNPPGSEGKSLAETCPGDVLGKPSQGCLDKVYQSTDQLPDLYEYFAALLEQHGYASQANTDPGKAIAAPSASLTMREYPSPQAASYYRQLNVYLRQPDTPETRVEIAFLVHNPPGLSAPTARNLSGTWEFTHVNGRFQGTIQLKQSGSALSGTWHTSAGKSEADSPVAGRVDGNTVVLTRSMGNLKQEYVLTISPDGGRVDGYGDGWGIQHANLNLYRAGAR
jgi:hypothetical protein